MKDGEEALSLLAEADVLYRKLVAEEFEGYDWSDFEVPVAGDGAPVGQRGGFFGALVGKKQK